MTRRLVTILAICIAIAAYRAQRVGDLGVADSRLATRYAARPFDSIAWRTATPTARGQMLVDLARRYRLTGRQATEVSRLLGPSECYVNYDDEPCYDVQFSATKYRLMFQVNHSYHPGKVRSVTIHQ